MGGTVWREWVGQWVVLKEQAQPPPLLSGPLSHGPSAGHWLPSHPSRLWGAQGLARHRSLAGLRPLEVSGNGLLSISHPGSPSESRLS